jgi:RNA polymerase sigma-70 factor (ECF subfamily)
VLKNGDGTVGAARSAAGEDARNRLFAELHAPVFRYVHRMTGDPDTAADIAQEAFVRLYMRGGGLPDDARPWLFRVAGNLVRDRARRQSTVIRFAHAGERVAADAPDAPDEAYERSERVKEVRKALDLLRPRDRKILLMREEGFSYEEIGEVLGVGRRSVPTLVMRALRRFREVYHNESR